MATKMAKMATDMAKRHGQMVLDASYEAAANAPDCNKNNNNSNNNNSFEQEQVAWQRIRNASLPCLRRRRRWRQRLDRQRLLMPQNDVISKKRTVITSWRSRRWLRSAVALPHGNLLDADVADDCSRLHSSYQPAARPPLPLLSHFPPLPVQLMMMTWRARFCWCETRREADKLLLYFVVSFLFVLFIFWAVVSALEVNNILSVFRLLLFSEVFLAKSLCDWN